MKGEPLQAGGQRGDQTHQRVLGDTSSLSQTFSFCTESHFFSSFREQSLQTDGMIQRCRARLKFDLKKGNLILTANAKLNGLLTQEISSFQRQRGKKYESRGNYHS